MKDIVIIANFCRDFSESDNGRFMYLCKELSQDNNVEIITSDFSHGAKKHKEPLKVKWPFKITFLHEPGYRKNISVQRFMSHQAWGREVEKYLGQRKKPDVIYSAVPSLTGPLAAAKYCENNNIRFVIDIQDLWPEAFRLAFNIPVLSDIAFAPFKNRADGIYSRADAICGVSRTYVNRALRVNTTCEGGHVVFLGTRLETFDENVRKNPVKKPIDELWIGYCGTLGASYDISVVIESLAILNLDNVRFIVMGDGEKRSEFDNLAKSKHIKCKFTGLLPYPKMCALLSSCDIAVNPIMHNAAQSIINKHGDYASAGIPVINTQENQEYRDLVDKYQMGFNVNNGDVQGMTEKIKQLVEDSDLRLRMGNNARRCAEERFDRKKTYQELVNQIIQNH